VMYAAATRKPWAARRDVRCTADVMDDRGSTASLKETVFSSAQA
jgi:hypothetical protein